MVVQRFFPFPRFSSSLLVGMMRYCVVLMGRWKETGGGRKMGDEWEGERVGDIEKSKK